MAADRQIVYFPHLFITEHESIKIGEVEIWNFSKREKFITDIDVRRRIECILQSERIGKQQVDDIGIVSIGNKDFRIFNEQELSEIDITKLLLFIGFLSQNNVNYEDINIGHLMATSENFRYVIRNFSLDSDSFGEAIGFIVQRIIMGYKIGEVEFPAPSWLPKPLSFSLDHELIEQLLWLRDNNKSLFEKMLEAIDVFYEAYFNSSDVSHSARILRQTSAFEILLNLQNRDDFKNKIEKYCAYNNERKYTYRFEIYDRKTKKKSLIKGKHTMKGIWADRFYTLRNHIIHGDIVQDADFLFLKQQRHFDVALLFFINSIKELINEIKEIKIDGKIWKIFYDSIKWTRRKDVFGKKGWGFIYEKDVWRQTLAKFVRNSNP